MRAVSLFVIILTLSVLSSYVTETSNAEDLIKEDENEIEHLQEVMATRSLDEEIGDQVTAKRSYYGKGMSSGRNRRKGSKSRGRVRYTWKGRKSHKNRGGRVRYTWKGRKSHRNRGGRVRYTWKGRKNYKHRGGRVRYTWKGRKSHKHRGGRIRYTWKGRKGSKSGRYGGVRPMSSWRNWGWGNKYRKSFDCLAHPCKNQGVCCHDGGYSRCMCPAGFTGNQCEKDINECARFRCPRGAKCFDQVNGFSCIFADSKEYCKKKQTDCSKKPCKNGGTCKPHGHRYKCICRPGYGGRHCQTNINECLSAPCSNGGTCVDGINKFTCKCPPGYGGKFCQSKMGKCRAGICLNRAECVNSQPYGIWKCVCKKGFAGSRCERVIKDCSTNPCKNGGTCCELKGGYVCKCDDGYSGKNCEKRVKDMYIRRGQGQLDFKMSGSDNPKSSHYSLRCRYSYSHKSVVCGRGYYLRTKSRSMVIKDLMKACKFPRRIAKRIAKAAGLSGKKARRCLRKYRLGKIRFSRHQQKRLFELDYRRQKRIAQRYLKKRCRKGFAIKKLKPFVRDLTMTLFKDGDFRYNTRQRRQNTKRILADIQSNNLKRIKRLFEDRNFWLKKVKLSRKKFLYIRRACRRECKRTGKC